MASKVFLFLVLVFGLFSHHVVEGNVFSKTQQEEDEDLERQLQMLNKSPVKIIKAKNGDIVDCVDIHKQPALDHPLLKDHKVQMRPSSFPTGFSSKIEAIVDSGENLIEYLGCPEGTVPIRRTTKEDLIRSKSFFETYNPRSRAHPDGIGVPGLHVAIHSSNWGNMTYHGLYGQINVANPKVDKNQFSAAMLWVSDIDGIQFLQTGWAVSPQIFGDNKTRLFVYSTPDPNPDLQKGCYNLQCHGFVQIDKDIVVGAEIYPVSVYGGMQRSITLTIFQDNTTGNWWLNDITNGRKNVGYWPKDIMSKLQKGAAHIAFGGLVRSGQDGESPPMGNGEYPNKDYTKACYIAQMHLIDEYYAMTELPEFGGFQDFVDDKDTVSNCYDIEYDGKTEGWKGYSMLFGGRGSQHFVSCGK